MSVAAGKNRNSRPERLSYLQRKGRRKQISQTYWAEEHETEAFQSDMPLDLRLSLLQRHGDFSIAYSTAVQPLLNHFGDDQGYFAYRKRWGHTFVLGDAVAANGHRADLLDRLISESRRLTFCQVAESTARQLNDRGFLINEMGYDTILDLDSYNFAGKEKEWLRYASNWTARRGYQIKEVNFSQISPAQVEEVSEAWRKTRTVKSKEVRFLNRPILLRDEQDVRWFCLFTPEGSLVSFVVLDPIYRDGQVAGYVTVFKRRHPAAPQYAEPSVMKHLIEQLQSEGVAELRLGLSPLAEIDDAKSEFRHSPLTSSAFRFTFQSKLTNKYFYHLAGHADYKRRFRGREEKVFFASPTRFNVVRLMALVGLCGVA
ncbi:MAG: phosphatidylglycerol lysyltransferase domain-containing protein [Planctomycetota bacterium]